MTITTSPCVALTAVISTITIAVTRGATTAILTTTRGVHVTKSPKRQRLNRWTTTHENTRREYSRSRLAVTTSKTNTTVQTRVRSLITEHRQKPVLADRVIQRSTLSQKRSRSDAINQPNAAMEDRRNGRRAAPDISTRSYRATQQILKRKRSSSLERNTRLNQGTRSNTVPRTHQYDRFRFSTRSKSYSSDDEGSTRSNAERRARLYNRTQSSRSRLSTPPSRSRSSSVKQRAETAEPIQAIKYPFIYCCFALPKIYIDKC